jgi:hypothetical protein
MSNFMGVGMQELPIGYIFEFDPTGISGAPDLSTPEKVHNYFGYGMWKAYGAGRVTIGANSVHPIGSEGGEETHTLISTELPSPIRSEKSVMLDVSKLGGFGSPIQQLSSGTYTAETGNITIANGNQPHNNMQPYKTVYRWRRIA